MQKFCKQLTALFLVLTLCFSMLPVTTMATGNGDAEGSIPETTASSEAVSSQEAEELLETTESAPESDAEYDETSYITADGLTEEENVASDYNNQDVVGALNEFAQAPTLMSDDVNLYRYTVLILDTSGSMSGTPASVQKEAAIKFCNSVLSADGMNYVAIVKLNTSSSVGCTFSNDIDTLTSYINGIPASGGTNINQALEKAEELLDAISDDGSTEIIKNIVLCSDGLPESGSTSTTGKYTSADHSSDYQYANVAYDTATTIKQKGFTIYSLGFFHSLSGTDLAFGQLFMSDLASDGHYYEVTDVDDLEFVFGEIASEITVTAYPFSFAGHLVHHDVTSTCYYSDGYFLNDASVYSSHLASMSLCFELTTWSRYTGSWAKDENGNNVAIDAKDTRWENAYELLTALGYEHIDLNEFWDGDPTKDSIGAIAAKKTNQYDDSTMIAVGVRGGGYGQEWASNFTVGKTGEHDGFSEAKEKVLEFLKEYIATNNITGEIKIWLVGYSRAGCVANMVGGELVDGYSLGDDVTVAQENLFVYTFEAPQGALYTDTSSGDYSNIHNIINLNDIVPLVAPSSWGFARYNTDRWLPSAATSGNFKNQKDNMLEYYDDFEGYDGYYIQEYGTQFEVIVNWSKILPGGDPFVEIEYYDVPTSVVLAESSSFLFDGAIGDRETYYYDFQAGVREIMALLNGGTLSDLLDEGISAEEFLTKFFNELTVDRVIEIVKPMIALNFDSFETRKDKVKDNLSNFVKDVLNDSDLWGAVAFVADLGNTLTDTLWRIFESVLEDLFDKNTNSLQSFVDLIIMVAEGGLLQAHYPELTLAWVMSQDSYYAEGQTDFSCTNYRIVHINCPVNVEVYRADTGKLVAAITDDVAEEITGSSIYAYINSNGEKMVILPSDTDYTLTITATDDGTMSYTVDEYDLTNMSNARIVNYTNVDITAGDVLTANVPALDESEQQTALTNGSSVDYSLSGNDGAEIAPDNEVSGSDAAVVYSVNISSNSDVGTVSGGGSYSLGSYAKVVASPMNGSTFQGWYQDDVLVSEELTYRFAVTEDVVLVANFSETETYVMTVVTSGDGAVSNEQIEVPAGTQVQLEAIADMEDGFIGWSADAGEFEDVTSATTWYTMPACDITITATFTSSHTHNYTAVVTDPTCTEQGYTTYTCDKCGDSYKDDYVDATGHSWDDGVVTKEPTEEAEGVKTYTCEGCGDTKTESIPALEPTEPEEPSVPSTPVKPIWQSWLEKLFGDWWGDEEEECDHEYDSVITEPTCEEKGYTTHTCTKCGDTYKDSYIDALGHQYEDGICTQCGKTEPVKPAKPNWKDILEKLLGWWK